MGNAQSTPPISSSVQPPPPPMRTYTPMLNTDFPGNDIQQLSMDQQGCSKACDITPRCNGYVESSDNTTCWLKSDFKNGSSNVMNRNSYILPFYTPQMASASVPVVSSRSYTVQQNMDYSGNDIKQLSGDPSSCVKACDSMPIDCTGFVMSSDNTTCWLKKSDFKNGTSNVSRKSYIVKEAITPTVTIAQSQPVNMSYVPMGVNY